MRKPLIAIFIAFSSLHAVAQTPKEVRLADSLLKAGSFKVVNTTYDFPKEISDLQNKAVSNLKKNPEWADKHLVKMVLNGDVDIPQMLKEYGLTADEFNQLILGFKAGKTAFFSDTSTIIIKKNSGIITFHCIGEKSVFNFLMIDVKKNQISYDNLIFAKEKELNKDKHFPILIGMQTTDSKEGSSKKQSKLIATGLSLGVNRGDTRPTLGLCIAEREINSVVFSYTYPTITILY